MSFLHFIKKIGESLKDIFLFAVRIAWGTWFLLTGLGKWNTFDKVVDYFRELGIPYPEFNAYAVMLTEMIGGALLILGLFSRVAAIPLIVVMLVALVTAHHEAVFNLINNPQEILNQAPFTFLMAALIVFIFGPGRLSLDYLMSRNCKNKHGDKCDFE